MDSAFQAFVAAVVSFLFVSVVLATLFLLCATRRRQPKPSSSDVETDRTRFSRAKNPETVSFDPAITSISLEELIEATNNFSANLIIGDGGFGFVYKAELPAGTVAVKRLSTDAFHGFREFLAEMDTLGRIHHRNLVRLLAYCVSGNDRLLIYEFLRGGSLDQWLHCPDSVQLSGSGPARGLGWLTRVRIVRDVASGLAFLHEECSPPIIHRDIKASNVLLDGGLEARIADFGLARQVNSSVSRSAVMTQAAGTVGYMPPEYINGTTTAATKKGDVYSFGILMLEVVTRRRPNLAIRADDGKEMRLAHWALKMVREERGMEILDPEIGEEGEGLDEEQVGEFLQLALKCIENIPNMRPAMGEVMGALNQLWKREMV